MLLIATTVHIAANSLNSMCDVLVVDEASQMFPESFVAIMLANLFVRVVILLGDTQQLRLLVLIRSGSEFNLLAARSIMEHMD